MRPWCHAPSPQHGHEAMVPHPLTLAWARGHGAMPPHLSMGTRQWCHTPSLQHGHEAMVPHTLTSAWARGHGATPPHHSMGTRPWCHAHSPQHGRGAESLSRHLQKPRKWLHPRERGYVTAGGINRKWACQWVGLLHCPPAQLGRHVA